MLSGIASPTLFISWYVFLRRYSCIANLFRLHLYPIPGHRSRHEIGLMEQRRLNILFERSSLALGGRQVALLLFFFVGGEALASKLLFGSFSHYAVSYNFGCANGENFSGRKAGIVSQKPREKEREKRAETKHRQ